MNTSKERAILSPVVMSMYAVRDATLQSEVYAGARFRLAVCRRTMRASVKREVVVDVKKKSGWWERCILVRNHVLKAG